jgi:hypothetical protein
MGGRLNGQNRGESRLTVTGLLMEGTCSRSGRVPQPLERLSTQTWRGHFLHRAGVLLVRGEVK